MKVGTINSNIFETLSDVEASSVNGGDTTLIVIHPDGSKDYYYYDKSGNEYDHGHVNPPSQAATT